MPNDRNGHITVKNLYLTLECSCLVTDTISSIQTMGGFDHGAVLGSEVGQLMEFVVGCDGHEDDDDDDDFYFYYKQTLSYHDF